MYTARNDKTWLIESEQRQRVRQDMTFGTPRDCECVSNIVENATMVSNIKFVHY